MRVARENPTWGYTRLRGALKNLGHELGRNTIKRILAEHGIAPAPERGRSMSWSTFIKAHWGAIAATDLFTVEVVNLFGLVRYHVLFVIDIATRCVCIGGITSDPNGEWMKQGQETSLTCGMVSSLASDTSSTTGTRYSPRRYVGC